MFDSHDNTIHINVAHRYQDLMFAYSDFTSVNKSSFLYCITSYFDFNTRKAFLEIVSPYVVSTPSSHDSLLEFLGMQCLAYKFDIYACSQI